MTNDDSAVLARQLAWLRRSYFGLDGRWYLKVRDRFGPAVAQELDEAVCASLGRLHVRAWTELHVLEGIDDCRAFGRFVLDVLATLAPDDETPPEIVVDEPDIFELEHRRCTIYEMGLAADYGAAEPGQLPGCGGNLALHRAWATAAGDYQVTQVPASGGPNGVQCRYRFERVAPAPYGAAEA